MTVGVDAAIMLKCPLSTNTSNQISALRMNKTILSVLSGISDVKKVASERLWRDIMLENLLEVDKRLGYSM